MNIFQLMKKEKKHKHFKKKPQYPGGQQAMKQFLKEQLIYPKEAMEAKIEGSVLVQYTVNQLGKVVHTKIISGIGYGCDAEAERIVGLLKFEVDKNKGFASKTTQTIGVHFKLKSQKKMATSTQIVYQMSPSKKTEASADDSTDASGGYEYTIEW